MEQEPTPPFPASLKLSERGVQIGFVQIPAGDFVEPFVDETLAKYSMSNPSEAFYPWEKLTHYLSPNFGRKPKGIIMHAARAGSTLQVACLRHAPGLTTYSEPAIINELLCSLPMSARCRHWRQEMIVALRLVIDLLGKHAGGQFVLKLRSWNSLFAPLIIEACPEIPWVFGVRDPVEIGVSVETKPPTWLRAFMEANNPFLPFAVAYGDVNCRETYFAAMFASFCDTIGDTSKRLGRLVHYHDLPGAVWECVCPHFRIRLTGDDVLRMKSVARYDAKRGGVFVPDSQMKQAKASAALRDAVRRIAAPALARLEKAFLLEGRHHNDHEKHYHLTYEA